MHVFVLFKLDFRKASVPLLDLWKSIPRRNRLKNHKIKTIQWYPKLTHPKGNIHTSNIC